MKQLLRKFVRSDVSVLMIAGVVSQAVNVVAYPVLTNFYTPEHFGLFSVLASTSTFAGAVVLLRIETLYQIAPKEEEEGLLHSSIVVALGMTALILMIALFFGEVLIGKIGANVESNTWHWSYAFLVAALALVNGLMSLGREVTAKNRRYNRLAVSQITRTALTVGGQLGLVLMLKNAGAGGLIAGFSLGMVTATLVIWPIRGAVIQTIVASPGLLIAATRSVLHQYRSYIRVDVVNVLIRLSTLVAYPIFVLASFGVAEAGLYAVASRITFIPIDVLGVAISTVYFQRFAKAVREGHGLARLYLVTLLGALCAALAITGLLSVASGPLVDMIFGDAWVRTGVIILCLLPTFVSRFVTVCIGSTPLAMKRPDILLYWNLSQLAIIGVALWATRDQTLEAFLLYSGFAFVAASTIYAFILLATISGLKTVEVT
tara:strand:+ start:10051 stop:11346 length:1296 start_codon:yes stop_codon:yes gene_type:complete